MIPLDEQEKTIHFLLDLNAEDDPAWLFLESRFRFISGRFLQAYNEYLSGIEAELRPTKTHPGSALPPDLEQYLAFLEAARTGRSQDVIFFVGKCLPTPWLVSPFKCVPLVSRQFA